MNKKCLSLIILFSVITIFSSCELGPLGPDGVDGLNGLDGADGLDGTDGNQGQNSRTVPGGTISVILAEGSSSLDSPLSSVIIMFDDDTTGIEGDEYYVEVDFSTFSAANNELSHSQTWYAPSVPPGSYYVYAWMEIGTVDYSLDTSGSTDEQIYNNQQVTVWDPTGNYRDAADAVIEITSLTSFLEPNYTCTDENAPQIDLTLYYSPPPA